MMYFDGSLMAMGVGAGVIHTSAKGNRMECAILLHFHTNYNVVEYEALIHVLKIAFNLSICRLYVRGHSKLVIDQVMKEALCRNDKMVTYYNKV